MAWVLVRPLVELREQVNLFAPNRDRASDGTIGDVAHSNSKSSHNYDDGSKNNAEWNGDPDSLQEVRAVDIDVDFKNGVSAQEFVNHLLKYCRSGEFWWIRYIIYNRRIWRKSNGWVAETYSGSNAHTQHIHVNSDYSQSADNKSGCNYRLSELLQEEYMPLTSADVEAIWGAKWGSGSNIITAGELLAQARSNARDANAKATALAEALNIVASKVDLDATELDAIRTTLAVPTAEQNADALLAKVGGFPMGELADLLREGLTEQQQAELVAELSQ